MKILNQDCRTKTNQLCENRIKKDKFIVFLADTYTIFREKCLNSLCCRRRRFPLRIWRQRTAGIQ